ncbi:hypothetical protein MPTK2_3g13410 [Marchantia polymorpha subsp. ruderalis]
MVTTRSSATAFIKRLVARGLTKYRSDSLHRSCASTRHLRTMWSVLRSSADSYQWHSGSFMYTNPTSCGSRLWNKWFSRGLRFSAEVLSLSAHRRHLSSPDSTPAAFLLTRCSRSSTRVMNIRSAPVPSVTAASQSDFRSTHDAFRALEVFFSECDLLLSSSAQLLPLLAAIAGSRFVLARSPRSQIALRRALRHRHRHHPSSKGLDRQLPPLLRSYKQS